MTCSAGCGTRKPACRAPSQEAFAGLAARSEAIYTFRQLGPPNYLNEHLAIGMESTAQHDTELIVRAKSLPDAAHSALETQVEPGEALSLAEPIAELRRLSRKELKRYFERLPVPSIDEIEGEYRALLLNQGHWFANVLTRLLVNRGGHWVGKAFQPASETGGYGYNIFRTRSGVRRSFRMHTYLREREAAPGYRYTIEYGETNSGTVGTIFDEVRRVVPGLYLGLGSVHLFGGRIFKRPRKVLFALAGPVTEFRQDASEKDVFDEGEQFPELEL